ncbi:MAG: thermonuclease family protein, partial [Verrucomicrobiota bacterium]
KNIVLPMTSLYIISCREVFSFCRRNILHILSTTMLLSAIFFYFGAERIRDRARAGDTDAFNDSDIVTVVDIIDGDEIVIATDEGRRTVLRLLGIQSFDATFSDPLLAQYGKTAFSYLETKAINKQGKLQLSKKRYDDENRLLGFIRLKDDTGAFTLDLGLNLVRRGYSLLYNKYPFILETEYQLVESEAREKLAGFWGNQALVERINTMKRAWQLERQQP